MIISALLHDVVGKVNHIAEPLSNPRIYAEKLHNNFVALHGVEFFVVDELRDKRGRDATPHQIRRLAVSLLPLCVCFGTTAFSYFGASSSLVVVTVIWMCASSLSRILMYLSLATRSDFVTIRYGILLVHHPYCLIRYPVLFSHGWKQSVIPPRRIAGATFIFPFAILSSTLRTFFTSTTDGESGFHSLRKSSRDFA